MTSTMIIVGIVSSFILQEKRKRRTETNAYFTGVCLSGGLAAAALCQKIKLPRIIGMLFVGILLGPYALNLLDVPSLAFRCLRQMALVTFSSKPDFP